MEPENKSSEDTLKKITNLENNIAQTTKISIKINKSFLDQELEIHDRSFLNAKRNSNHKKWFYSITIIFFIVLMGFLCFWALN